MHLMGSLRVILRYSLLQLPIIILLIILLIFSYGSDIISSTVMWIILVLWIIKDLVLYPFLWKAYDTRYQQRHNIIVGLSGTVNDRLDPEGYIVVKGEFWHARTDRESGVIEKGEKVKISGMNGLTLIVEPERPATN